jgi:hypothetical protein
MSQTPVRASEDRAALLVVFAVARAATSSPARRRRRDDVGGARVVGATREQPGGRGAPARLPCAE